MIVVRLCVWCRSDRVKESMIKVKLKMQGDGVGRLGRMRSRENVEVRGLRFLQKLGCWWPIP